MKANKIPLLIDNKTQSVCERGYDGRRIQKLKLAGIEVKNIMVIDTKNLFGNNSDILIVNMLLFLHFEDNSEKLSYLF
jgi:hypothetical protein